ncbi:caltractin [Novymonas esmeraldas]|uniref:Caltractin n=1 Tax=Novymonas esmeraldas TaxID=1808958 RepID=A0AAW0F419_9TRYP
MASSSFLREDIKEVFSIFDEDGSGTISMQEVGRALYTITGQRVPRTELLKLIAFAQDAVAKQQALQSQQDHGSPQHHPKGMGSGPDRPQSATRTADGDLQSPAAADGQPAATDTRPSSGGGAPGGNSSTGATSPVVQQGGAAAATTSPSAAAARNQARFVSPHSHQLDSSEGIDVDVFEQIVLRKLKHRSYEEELAYTFALLEDKSYLGFITKESVRRAAAETGEPLTEAEIAEMFDPLVTGVPTAAVDLSTFTDLQLAARKAEDS